MATNKRYTVPYRRKQEGKTDYYLRRRLLTSKTPRLVIRKTNKHLILQIITYHPTGDKILCTVTSNDLKKHGWKAGTANTPAAYLTGVLIAKKAHEKKIAACISDLGQYTSIKGTILYAAIKGANDHKLTIPCSNSVYPPDARINGTHIATYAQQLKTTNKEKYAQQFALHLKQGLAPEQLPRHFEKTLAAITGASP